MQQTALSTAVNTLHDMYIGIAKKRENLYLYRITFLDCPVSRNWHILKADNASMSVIRSCHCIGQLCLCRACWYHSAPHRHCLTSLLSVDAYLWLEQLVDTRFSAQRITWYFPWRSPPVTLPGFPYVAWNLEAGLHCRSDYLTRCLKWVDPFWSLNVCFPGAQYANVRM